MLHWLAGQRPPEGPTDSDTSAYIEPPETPAPVFAVRAFKQALFGTPQPAQPKPRRNSNTENARPRNVDSRPLRPGITRPKSANDAHAFIKQDAQPAVEPLGSPTKGILMTPGTAAAKKKNVTFGEDVLDNQEKKPLRTGLPDDCPGKFPSPGIKLSDDYEKDDDYLEKSKGRSKLTEAFEQARDESRKRKARGEKRGKIDRDDDQELEPEFAEPRSEDGKYWKHEYDVYRTNTQREVKKLITKQKAAKSFALTKDTQCIELAGQLKQEQKRAETLEAKTTELATQVKELYDKLQERQEAERKQLEEIAMLKRQLGREDAPRPTSSNGVIAVTLESRESEQEAPKEPTKAVEDPVQRPSEPYKPAGQPERPKTDLQTLRARLKSKTGSLQTKPSKDIWAQSFGSSSPLLTRNEDRPSVAPKGDPPAATEGSTNPLKTININTLSKERDSRRNSSLGSMVVECKSIPDLERVDSKNSADAEEQGGQESLVQPRDTHALSSKLHVTNKSNLDAARDKPHQIDETSAAEDISIQVPASNPFQPQAKTTPVRSGVSPAGPRDAPIMRSTLPNNTKENVSPSQKPDMLQNDLKVKPSVMWSSINAPQTSKRVTSMTGKDGKEVGGDRLEAARARINARGRVTS